MKLPVCRAIFIAVGLMIVSSCLFINVTNLVEAFGSGPPYYGRTTNMDKWSNPIPFLVVIDLCAIFVVFVLFSLLKKSRKHELRRANKNSEWTRER